jgi:malate dehydrogenase (oxaloacetate-decarboxylating)
MTDGMIIAGAQRLAALSPALKDPDNALLPDFQDAPVANLEIAVAVAEQAFEEGIQGVIWTKEEARTKAEEKQWWPVYGRYEYAEDGAK